MAGTHRPSRDGQDACSKISRELSQLRTMQREHPSLSLAALALLRSPLMSALSRPTGTVFVDTGWLRSRGICARQAVMDNGGGNSRSISPLSSISSSVSSSASLSPSPVSGPSLAGLSMLCTDFLVAIISMPPNPDNVSRRAAASRAPFAA